MTYRDDHLRRRQLMVALAAGGTGMLAGCTGDDGSGDDGSGDDGSGDDGSGDNGSEDDGSDNGGSEPTEIGFTHISSFEPEANDLADDLSDGSQGITLNPSATPAESASTREYLLNQFVAQSSEFDAAMMDVIWPAEFVENGWIAPVEDTEGVTDNMLDTPVEANTIDGELYGIPMFTDANAFYYRSDKLEEYGYDPPETYMEVVEQAQDILDRDDEIENGYIWQGGTNEGLTIMWLNWLWGFGGSVHQDGDLVVNTQEGIDALSHAVDLIQEYEVTPDNIPASGTDGNRQTFQNGNTLFMRQWPYAVSIYEDDTPVTGKFDVTTMPKAEGNPDANNSCLGGWSILINNFSEKKEAANTLANYVGTMEVQEKLALEYSRLPVREELYSEEYYDEQPSLEIFAEALQQTSARPASPQYGQFSEIVYTNCNQALVEEKTPQEALDDAQEEIDSEIN